ncbi:MAG: rhomboid family intramembrane serine protease [Deltaproteobacteria bacterium]|nr:rhomboid family intramembrane serine protease [Deltaproteobacteria bacterium]
MRQPVATRGFSLPPPRAVPVTTWLCGIILAVSLLAKIFESKTGVGADLLRFDVAAVLSLELWRLVTYPLVECTAFGLLFGLFFFYLIASWFETSFGSRDLLRFFVISSLGAAGLAIPLSFLVNLIMPFYDPGVSEGPDAAFDAMLVAFAVSMPNATIMFGFVLPMRARSVVYALLGLALIFGIMNGAAAFSITLGGMIMGYLLASGNWRPQRLLNKLKLRRARRRGHGFYVVPPKHETYH